MVHRNNPYWVYPELLAFYEDQGLTATFFFLGRAWEGFSYRYNIHRKPFRQLIRRIEQHGHEVGLHSSLHAFKHPRRIRREKNRLEQVTRHSLTGVRQHYLRLEFPRAWSLFHQAGLRYDSSVGSNRGLGFPTGSSFPYLPAQCGVEVPESLVEIPFAVMDYPWKHLGDIDRAWEHFQNLAYNIRNSQGHLCLLWHPSNLAETDFRPLWERFFLWMATQNAFVTTLDQMATWWVSRHRVLLKTLQIENDRISLLLETPAEIRGLTLEIFSEEALSLEHSVGSLMPIDGKRYFLILPQLRPGQTPVRLSRKTQK